MKKIRIGFLFGIICVLFVGCSKGELKMRTESELLSLINNDIIYEQLITKDYLFDDSINFYGKSIEKVDTINKLECIRKKDNNIYSIIKFKNNVLLFLLFENSNNGYIVRDVWYYGKKIYKNDFSFLKIGKSKICDVKNIDTYGNFVLYASSMEPTSFHYTIDGYLVKINYNFNGNEFIVSSIEYSPINIDTVISNLLSIDKDGLF